MITDDGGTLRLRGPVTFATHVALREASTPLVRQGAHTVDWTAVDAVDSSALALILHWQRCQEPAGRRIAQLHLPPSLLALADLYGVDGLIVST